MDFTNLVPELPESPKFPSTTPVTIYQEGPGLLDLSQNGNSELKYFLKFSTKKTIFFRISAVSSGQNCDNFQRVFDWEVKFEPLDILPGEIIVISSDEEETTRLQKDS